MVGTLLKGVTLFCASSAWHDLLNLAAYTYPLFSTNCIHLCIYWWLRICSNNKILCFACPTFYIVKNEDFLLTSSRVHDFMQRHHFVTIRPRIFKARHEKSSSWTGGWIVTPGSSPFTLFGVDRDHGIWIWSRRLGWWISHDDQWRWALNVKSIRNSKSTSVEGELPPLTKSLFGRTKWW